MSFFLKCPLADNCKKLGLVFDDVVGIVEMINCKDVKVQVCIPFLSVSTECFVYGFICSASAHPSTLVLLIRFLFFLQVIGKVPTISINKTDGCHVYLSKDSLSCEIISAKSSEMNVLVPNKDGEYVSEEAVIKDFVSSIIAQM